MKNFISQHRNKHACLINCFKPIALIGFGLLSSLIIQACSSDDTPAPAPKTETPKPALTGTAAVLAAYGFDPKTYETEKNDHLMRILRPTLSREQAMTYPTEKTLELLKALSSDTRTQKNFRTLFRPYLTALGFDMDAYGLPETPTFYELEYVHAKRDITPIRTSLLTLIAAAKADSDEDNNCLAVVLKGVGDTEVMKATVKKLQDALPDTEESRKAFSDGIARDRELTQQIIDGIDGDLAQQGAYLSNLKDAEADHHMHIKMFEKEVSDLQLKLQAAQTDEDRNKISQEIRNKRGQIEDYKYGLIEIAEEAKKIQSQDGANALMLTKRSIAEKRLETWNAIFPK